MTTLEELAQRVAKIEARNKKVESDKAWEMSLARKLLVAVLTYLVVSIFMNALTDFFNQYILYVIFALLLVQGALVVGVLLLYRKLRHIFLSIL